jgi:hypothetical protein
MAKIIRLGSAKPDDPIYSGGYEVFSHPAYGGSSTDTPKSTDGEPLDDTSSVKPTKPASP